MKKNNLIKIILILSLSSMAFAQENFEHAAEVSKKSVVYISVYNKVEESGSVRYSKTGYGSGTILTKDGYLVTNYHVIKGGDYFQAVLWDGTECEFEKIDQRYYLSDSSADIAVMKLKEVRARKFASIKISNSDNVKPGQWVIAVGSPYNLKHSISFGIISSVNRYDVGFTEIEDFIQTDVPINPGNSGGPLVNKMGQMVGINTAIRTVSGGFQGISFTIPSNMVIRIFNDLLKYKRVRRGWLGVLVKNEMKDSDLGNFDVRVVSVLNNSPSQNAGIIEGDLIREVNSEIINSKGELLKIVKNSAIGSKLNIIVDRKGKILTKKIVLVEKNKYIQYGKTLRRIRDRYGVLFDIDAQKNRIVVSYVSPYKVSTYGDYFVPGDIVLKINNRSISTLKQLYLVLERSNYRIYNALVFRNEKNMGFKIEN